jgi:FMN reductase
MSLGTAVVVGNPSELNLRPLLVELGASVSTPALFLLDDEHDRPEAYDGWLGRARPLVHRPLPRTTGVTA